MSRPSRRRVLSLAGGGVLAAKTGGIAAILATGRAPAYAQTTTVHWLRWNDYVPAADQALRDMLPEAEKALGIKINLERVNLNDLQPRITTGIQSGTGADIVMLFNNHPHLYAASVADLSDVAEDIGKAQGGYYPSAKGNCHDGKRWLGMPIGDHRRDDRLPEVMVRRDRRHRRIPTPGTSTARPARSSRRRGARSASRSASRSAIRSIFTYPFLWSFGGKEVEADGKTVAINSKETIEAIKYMAAFWKEAHDEGGLAWDDANNNRAFLSGTICATLNGASIYIEALRKPDQYKTENGRADEGRHPARAAAEGPDGQFGYARPACARRCRPTPRTRRRPRSCSSWFHTTANYDKWFSDGQRLLFGHDHRMGEQLHVEGGSGDAALQGGGPARARFRAIPDRAVPSPPKRCPSIVIVNMFGRACQGKLTAEEAAATAEKELKQIYG